jgi:ectoine hydroxylase-related dioxygenase (phytanoyl-CoA dioxygenase family)
MTQIAIPSGSPESPRKHGLSGAEIEDLKRQFAADGYLVIKNVVSKQKLSALHAKVSAEFDRARHTGTLFNGGGLVSGHLNCFPGEESRFAYESLRDYGIIDLIKAISPQSTRQPNVGCNFNLPGSVTQHYHMDRTFTNEFMIANIAVVDTDLVNGAIDVIPGSHKQFYPFWKFVADGVARGHKRLPAEAGDVLVRVSNLWHRGMPNRSAVPRPMLAFSWEDGGSNYEDPFAIDGGKVMFRPNWFRPTRLGRLRERVFVTAPFSYSAYRIVDSLVSNKSY